MGVEGGVGLGVGIGDGLGVGDGVEGGWGVGAGAGGGAGAASCVTTNLCPPMSARPTRTPPLFAATRNPMVALILPFAPVVIVSQPLSLDDVHPQPGSV
jgi:hypothetical protein